MWGNFSPIRVAGAESPPREEQNPITPHPSCLCHASGGVVEAEGGGGQYPWWKVVVMLNGVPAYTGLISQVQVSRVPAR